MALAATDARSETSGAGSARSSGSRKYRVVSRGSNVDESLFGSSKPRSKGSGRKVMVGEVSRVSCHTYKGGRLAVECHGISSGDG